MKNEIKILHILPSLDGSGIARILYDYYLRMPSNVKFDFAVSSEKEGVFERRLIERGSQITHLPKIRKNLIKFLHEMSKTIERGNYDIVHSHNDFHGFFELYIAKRKKIKVRIAHSHRANQPFSFFEKVIKLIFTPLTKKCATDLFACGADASRWAWGKNNESVFLMRNAIDAKLFSFSLIDRNEIRNELNIQNKFVIGNVARFSKQKNHMFLIEVFASLCKKRKDAILLLVGRGELFDDVVAKSKELGVFDKIIFAGVKNDVQKYLSSMDLFVLPSFFEGLPVSMVEVQANGLPSIVSNTITSEIKILNNVIFLPINNYEIWVEALSNKQFIREDVDLSNSEYNIDVAAQILYKKYALLKNK